MTSSCLEHMPDGAACAALRLRVRGRVQGVGFRPHVYRLACDLKLAGWVRNDLEGVLIHVEGSAAGLAAFRDRLAAEAPPRAEIAGVECCAATRTSADRFLIIASPSERILAVDLRVPADLAICPACRDDIKQPASRRSNYPFTTCAACGPRYSILTGLPYDRARTAMACFALCAACQEEHANPIDRRFHAETIACPQCGPELVLRSAGGECLASRDKALSLAIGLLRDGKIIAVKGIGGFQLAVRPDAHDAVRRLRQKKRRPSKPLALMVASLRVAEGIAIVDRAARSQLESAANCIVVVPWRKDVDATLRDDVAPGLDRVGLFLPTTPLHQLLLDGVDRPLVVTSGNRGEEPIAASDAEAMGALGDIADAFLTHDRDIIRRVDDSVVTMNGDRSMPVRIGRGLAPLPLPALERWAARQRGSARSSLLATGGQQKAALALWTGRQAVLGPHLGDLDCAATQAAYVEAATALTALFGCQPGAVVCDAHPDYWSTRWAYRCHGVETVAVLHHHAHAVSAMVEHELLDRRVLALTWDGAGLGDGESIWGGEALLAGLTGFQRLASLRPILLLGGEAAVRQPWRVAFALLIDSLGFERVLRDARLLARLGLDRARASLLLRMRSAGANVVATSSMGRLFDGIAALVLGVLETTYEGEAAARLEAVVEDEEQGAYDLDSTDDSTPRQGDWRGLVRAVVRDIETGVRPGVIAARFHRALAAWAVSSVAAESVTDVVLTGGCFVNAFLARQVSRRLASQGKSVYTHQQIPCNDGGLAVGQLAVGMARLLGASASAR